ncbi:MAG: efflux RND transporter periplasmic adaptor subunit [Sphingobacteriaceae bacterium]
MDIKHKNTAKKIIVMLLSGMILMACQGEKKADHAAEAGHEEHEEAAELALTTAQMKAVGITIGPLEQKNLNAVVKANGQLAVPPQNKADVSVLSGGIIRQIKVLEGQHVSRGQVLATVENQELIKIQQDYLAAKSSFSYIEAEYERQQKLKEAGAGTGKLFQLAEATYHADRARISAYEKQLSQLGISSAAIASGNMVSQFPLKSPITGTVGQITANTGTFVQPGTSIMVVVDNSKLHCDLIVFERDLMKVKIGQQVNLMLTNQENQQVTGSINGINKSFENESKGVIVHAIINNAEKNNLIPGMYVTALISVGSELVLAVPDDAVIRWEGREYVFLAEENKKDEMVHFKRAEVKSGVSELGFVQITPLEKLADGVMITTKGAFYLQSKAVGSTDAH